MGDHQRGALRGEPLQNLLDGGLAGRVDVAGGLVEVRWSPTGAQLFLQVRTAVLNNDLAGSFRRWYPGFTHNGGPAEIEVDFAA